MDEQVNAEWAKDAAAQIDSAVVEWNETHPRANPVRIVWGHVDPHEASEEATLPTDYQHQQGLLAYFDLDVEILISMSGDPDLPDRCTLIARFQEPLTLPLEPPLLYNSLKSLDDAVSLSLFPDLDMSEILVVGVEAVVPVESITARILGDALRRLQASYGLAFRLLATGEGDDRWSMDASNGS